MNDCLTVIVGLCVCWKEMGMLSNFGGVIGARTLRPLSRDTIRCRVAVGPTMLMTT